MKAMILAAGLGKRMRPLTDRTPKPLLKIAGRYLIDYHLENLAKAGIKEVVINTHWLAEQLPEALGTGEQWGLNLSFSHEPELLETAGGIVKALPYLSDGQAPFLLLNGDVFSELNLEKWLAQTPVLDNDKLACLALVNNPLHHPQGDFKFDAKTGLLYPLTKAPDFPSFTYSGFGVFHPNFFKGLSSGPRPLGPLLMASANSGQLLGSMHDDYWLDVGTPDRYAALNARVQVSNQTK